MSHRNNGIRSNDMKIDNKNGTVSEAEYFSPAITTTIATNATIV